MKNYEGFDRWSSAYCPSVLPVLRSTLMEDLSFVVYGWIILELSVVGVYRELDMHLTAAELAVKSARYMHL